MATAVPRGRRAWGLARGVLIDLHCHTRVHSACSALSPEELVRLARAARLDALCLTEHDRLWDSATIAALSDELSFPLLRAMEVTTELGHILVFGLDVATPDMYVAATLRRRVEAAGGLMFLAHPARAGQPRVDLRVNAPLFDGVEGVNGSDGRAENEAGAHLGRGLTLPPIGGSDCHSPREAGTAATRLQQAVATVGELIAELRRGRHRAVDLRGLEGS